VGGYNLSKTMVFNTITADKNAEYLTENFFKIMFFVGKIT